jgi:alr1266 protein
MNPEDTEATTYLEISVENPPISKIYEWFTQGKLIVNRRYQRKLVWTLEDKQALVETISNRYPLPNILLAAVEDGYEIIDGLQRINAIIDFINQQFTTSSGYLFNTHEWPAAKQYLSSAIGSDAETTDTPKESGEESNLLTGKQVANFVQYVTPISIMRGATKEQIDDVFARINRYGHKLSDQEHRQAGVTSEFSNFVRELAAEIRGDNTKQIVNLKEMPQISISTPRGKLNYQVVANDTVWVKLKILNAGDLVTSEDEQFLAELTASLLDARILSRSREALDELYMNSTRIDELDRKLRDYGTKRLKEHIHYCIDELVKITRSSSSENLRDLIKESNKRQTNPVPAFANNMLVALFRSLINDERHVTDYEGLARDFNQIYAQTQGKRRAKSSEQRETVISQISGIIKQHTSEGLSASINHDPHSSEIRDMIRDTSIETARVEFKQGLLPVRSSISAANLSSNETLKKILRTAVAIANVSPSTDGIIIIGVADSREAANRISKAYKFVPKQIGSRYIVGIDRECDSMGLTLEQYQHQVRDYIITSSLCDHLRAALVNELKIVELEGMHILSIRVPAQNDVSMFEDKFYVRQGDQTIEATGTMIGDIYRRF